MPGLAEFVLDDLYDKLPASPLTGWAGSSTNTSADRSGSMWSWLMNAVTRVAPVFRSWPATYRWSGTITLGDRPTQASHWERKADQRDESYQRLTTHIGAGPRTVSSG